MSISELKQEVDRLSPEERRQLTAYLCTRDDMLNPVFRSKFTYKTDDQSPDLWVSIKAAERLLQQSE